MSAVAATVPTMEPALPFVAPESRRCLNSSRGALYKTLHSARRMLRKRLQERGLSEDIWRKESE